MKHDKYTERQVKIHPYTVVTNRDKAQAEKINPVLVEVWRMVTVYVLMAERELDDLAMLGA